MPVKKYIQDGVFVHESISSSDGATPYEKSMELKKALEESAQRETTGYVLEHLEKYARVKLEAPIIKRKKGQRPESFQKELESNERQRRDCEGLLLHIDFLQKKTCKLKDAKRIYFTPKECDFLMAKFYYLGVLAQQADIRPIEPVAISEANKKEHSQDSRLIKQRVLRETIKKVFKEYPKCRKTLGDVWNHIEALKDKNIIDPETENQYQVEIKGDTFFINRPDIKKPFKYEKTSIRRYIAALK
jgi:hypothetical protein